MDVRKKMNPPKIYSYYEAMVSLFWLKLVMIVTRIENDILRLSVFASKTCALNYTSKLSFCYQGNES